VPIGLARPALMLEKGPESLAASEAQVSSNGQLSFSVIIPARNEEVAIRNCLESLARQQFSRERFEVIVVDNGSTDATVEVATSFKHSLNVSVLSAPGVTVACLRNRGARVSAGTTLAFLDADMLVADDWLHQAEAIFQSTRTAVVGGPLSVPKGSSWVARYWFGRLAAHGKPSYIRSGNLMITRSDFFSVGGFDEDLKSNEDCEFCLRARTSGMRMIERNEICAVHSGSPQTLGAFFRREIWHGTSTLRVFIRNFPTVQNGKPVLFGLYALFCLVATIPMAVVSVYMVRPELLFLPLAMLMTPPLALAIASGVRDGWRGVPALFLLFSTYGVARGLGLMRLGRFSHNRKDLQNRLLDSKTISR
jgi:cellulose synthase/poly-beta-1,6-N-acetylglucosamine synthase-like glycosyltransferase